MSFASTQGLSPSYETIEISKPIYSSNTAPATSNQQLGWFANTVAPANVALTTNVQSQFMSINNVLPGTYTIFVDVPLQGNATCAISSITIELFGSVSETIKLYTDTYPITSANQFNIQRTMSLVYSNPTTQNFEVIVQATFATAGLSAVIANSYFSMARIA
jgi:hypothetical protein